MQLHFSVGEPAGLSDQQRNEFLELLKEQGQVDTPSLDKIGRCAFLCLVYCDGIAIGIAAIKDVSKSAFGRAGVDHLAEKYSKELGYIYVRENFNGLGIAKTCCRLLLREIGKVNVFATTENSEQNAMKYILKSLGFNKDGHTYIGKKTGKQIVLMLRCIGE